MPANLAADFNVIARQHFRLDKLAPPTQVTASWDVCAWLYYDEAKAAFDSLFWAARASCEALQAQRETALVQEPGLNMAAFRLAEKRDRDRARALNVRQRADFVKFVKANPSYSQALNRLDTRNISLSGSAELQALRHFNALQHLKISLFQANGPQFNITTEPIRAQWLASALRAMPLLENLDLRLSGEVSATRIKGMSSPLDLESAPLNTASLAQLVLPTIAAGPHLQTLTLDLTFWMEGGLGWRASIWEEPNDFLAAFANSSTFVQARMFENMFQTRRPPLGWPLLSYAANQIFGALLGTERIRQNLIADRDQPMPSPNFPGLIIDEVEGVDMRNVRVVPSPSRDTNPASAA